jgi:Holliday junction resolvasome RuvABC endonuclease subunit
MERLLALDISSSTIGWSVLERDKTSITLIDYGHIKPPTKAKAAKAGYGYSYRLHEISKAIIELVGSTQPDTVIVEDYAKKFSSGRSSANTIIVLATVNEVVSLVCFQLVGKEVTRIPVTRLRSVVKKQHLVDVKDKDDAMKLCKKLFKNFVTVNNRNGNTKKECYDESDSIIVGLGYHILS